MQGKMALAPCHANRVFVSSSHRAGKRFGRRAARPNVDPGPPNAEATPKFARQTGRNCGFCHSGAPRLNDTGLAFKNNGFRFPNSDEAPDEDHKVAPAQ